MITRKRKNSKQPVGGKCVKMEGSINCLIPKDLNIINRATDPHSDSQGQSYNEEVKSTCLTSSLSSLPNSPESTLRSINLNPKSILGVRNSY